MAKSAADAKGETDNSPEEVATVGVPIAAGRFSRVGLFARRWTTPEITPRARETSPTPMAQRASRLVCPSLGVAMPSVSWPSYRIFLPFVGHLLPRLRSRRDEVPRRRNGNGDMNQGALSGRRVPIGTGMTFAAPSRKLDGLGAVLQRLIPTGERSGLWMHTATMGSVSLRD